MIETAERKIEKYRRQYDEAATTMQTAVAEAGLRAVVHVVMAETGVSSEQAVRAQVKEQGTLRRLLDGSGRLVVSVARSALADPFAFDAFDAATYAVGKLLAEAWRLRGGDQ